MASLPAGPAETMRALQQMDEELVRAVAARDVDRLLDAFYAEDARMLPHEMSMAANPAAIRSYWLRLFEDGLTGLALDTTHLEVSGNLAYALGSYAAVLEPPGGPSSRLKGRYLVVYRRQDATRWRAVAHMFASEGQ